MNVLLVDGYKIIEAGNFGLGSLYAYLKQEGVNCRVALDGYESFGARKDIAWADMVGISVSTRNLHEARKLIDKLPDTKMVVCGGRLPSALPKVLLEEYPKVDFAIQKEGEDRLYQLIKAIESGTPHQDIDGLVYRDNGSIVVNPARAYVDLDKLPIVTEGAFTGNGSARITFSRGCYGSCTFCPEDTRMRFRDPQLIADDMLVHSMERGYDQFLLGAANSFANRRHLEAVLERIERMEIPLKTVKFLGRVNDMVRHMNILQDYLDSPLISEGIRVEVGLESHSDNALGLIRKKTDARLNETAIQGLRRLSIPKGKKVDILIDNILFTHPDMTWNDLFDNLLFLGRFRFSRLDSERVKFRFHVNQNLIGIPGTPFYQELLARGYEPNGWNLEIHEYSFTDPMVQFAYDYIDEQKEEHEGGLKELVRKRGSELILDILEARKKAGLLGEE